MRFLRGVLFWKTPHQVSICQVAGWLACGWLLVGCWAQAASSDDIDFQRDIRPLLSDACFQCHGPDEGKRQADLRLDISEGAYADLDGRRVLVPGDPKASHLFLRVTHDDPDQRMPPADSVRQLTEAEIQLKLAPNGMRSGLLCRPSGLRCRRSRITNGSKIRWTTSCNPDLTKPGFNPWLRHPGKH